MLDRENNVKPARDLQEFLKERFDNQQNMCNILHNERQKRFDRNKRAEGQLRGLPKYDIGDKLYVQFPKGRFRPLGKSTKLSPLNNGPYTVLEKLRDGLVYSL